MPDATENRAYWPRVLIFLALALAGWGLLGMRFSGWGVALGAGLAIGCSAGLLSAVAPFPVLVHRLGISSFRPAVALWFIRHAVLAVALLFFWGLAEDLGPLRELSALQAIVAGLLAVSLAVTHSEPLHESNRVLRSMLR